MKKELDADVLPSSTPRALGSIESSREESGTTPAPPSKRRRTTSWMKLSEQQEISRGIVRALWKRGTDWFNTARTEARRLFTSELGVLFYNNFRPLWNRVEQVDYASLLKDVPLSFRAKVFENQLEFTKKNQPLLSDMFARFKGFSMRVKYHVQVFQSDEDRGNLSLSGEERIMERNINILDVAIKY